jgi:hypothetical protein
MWHWIRLSIFGLGLITLCQATAATSIVILANKTEIAVAADSRMLLRFGKIGPDTSSHSRELSAIRRPTLLSDITQSTSL